MKLIDYSIHENSVQLTTDNALKLRVQTVGADILRIEAREQDAGWISEVTAVYRKAIDEYNRTGAFESNEADLELLDDLAPEGSTYGHYFRGVL
jgi:collagenase-like PrtC family protease